MIGPAVTLPYYKREDIQNEIVRNAKDREVAVRFGDKGFGKRPDVLNYPADILELAKQGATSFHASEELWSNPLRLDPNMRKGEMEDLRSGWDLVIDIDCPVWSISKITAWLIIKSLKELGLTSISAKFSGNKGFHIGVPFEVFPKIKGTEETRKRFPDAARKIAAYLLEYIGKNHIQVAHDEIIFGKRFKVNIDKLGTLLGKDIDALTYWKCRNCNKKVQEVEHEYKEVIVNSDDIEFMAEESYDAKKSSFKKKSCGCSSPDFIKLLKIEAIIDIDTILISSRHLYRMPYSLHEKSGLASIPFNPEKILEFRKEFAKPENVKVTKHRFLDKDNAKPDEGSRIMDDAFRFIVDEETDPKEINLSKEYEIPKSAMPADLFPPCIKKILGGIEDGRKRSLFTLVNFLNCVGWDYDKIESALKEWNKKNNEPLREVLLVGQLRYHKQQKKRILPPNCSNKMYYSDIGCCVPDSICRKVKNPVNYSKIRIKALGRSNADKAEPKASKPRLTEEQKEMRRQYRQQLKENAQEVNKQQSL